jgi:hypothetical protein
MQYASLLLILRALHLAVFDQPGEKRLIQQPIGLTGNVIMDTSGTQEEQFFCS